MNHESKVSIIKKKEQMTEKSAAVQVFPIQSGVVEERRALEEMCFAKCERDLFVFCDPALPCSVDVHTIIIVEDICSALSTSLREGYTLAVAPLACSGGTCAILQDELGVRMCIIEVTEAFFSELLRLVSPGRSGRSRSATKKRRTC